VGSIQFGLVWIEARPASPLVELRAAEHAPPQCFSPQALGFSVSVFFLGSFPDLRRHFSLCFSRVGRRRSWFFPKYTVVFLFAGRDCSGLRAACPDFRLSQAPPLSGFPIRRSRARSCRQGVFLAFAGARRLVPGSLIPRAGSPRRHRVFLHALGFGAAGEILVLSADSSH
jgi:hypothetical protein